MLCIFYLADFSAGFVASVEAHSPFTYSHYIMDTTKIRSKLDFLLSTADRSSHATDREGKWRVLNRSVLVLSAWV